MKVYRFLRESSCDYKTLLKGGENESRNLTKLGLISPSFIYLQKPCFISESGFNTFGENKEMTKYFYASLAEVFLALYRHYRHYDYLQKEKSSIYTIMEVDVPVSVLCQYMGFGFYEKHDFLEFRIPYRVLALELAKNYPSYFDNLIDFYNRNLSNEALDNHWQYHDFDSFLDEEMKAIYQYNRYSIYPLFCFEPKSMRAFSLEGEGEALEKIIQEYCDWSLRFLKARENILSSQGEFSVEELMASLDEENSAFKKVLKL